MALGKHIIAEFNQCNADLLNDESYIEQCLLEAAKLANATIIKTCFHKFSPFGVTGVVVIAESHLSIHTWVEYNYAAVDIFTCGDKMDPEVAIKYLAEKLEANDVTYVTLNRGIGYDRVHPSFLLSYNPRVV